jgi:queuosine precursor transporter
VATRARRTRPRRITPLVAPPVSIAGVIPRLRAPLLASALVATVVAANVATARLGFVDAGFGLIVSAGTFAAGLALAVRDALDRVGGLRWVLPAIVVGVALSGLLATPALALASAAAFALSELADLGAWRAVRARSIAAAVVVSNLLGALVDTAVFLPLAGLPVTPAAFGGQVLVKAGYVTVAALLVVAAARAARPGGVTA